MCRWFLSVTLVLPTIALTVNAARAQVPQAASRENAPDKILFDFEDNAEIEAWSHFERPASEPSIPDASEPRAKIEPATEHATSGERCLKITFAGGRWPAIASTRIPADWMPYWTFQADVTASRDCVVGFAAIQEQSLPGGGWDATVSRWTKTAFLRPGKNVVTGTLHDADEYYAINRKLGAVIRFEIFMYRPHEGESIYVDNIRLVTAKEAPAPSLTEFKVQGTDWAVSGVGELGKKLRDDWRLPDAKDLEQLEAGFRARYDDLRKLHPRAVLAVFRDGQNGYDPVRPDAVYSGWTDAYWSSHGPDGMTVERSTNTGLESGHEVFMRHRSPLMRVDLSSIPRGSNILAAQLVIIRNYDGPVKDHRPDQPNMWVVEPCNRPWVEAEVNGYEYARDRFWKAVGGMHWGEDADFLPLYLAYGPSQGKVNHWDFAEAVRFWTDGRHPNYGFMLHGDAGDWLVRAHSRETEKIEDRPAVWAIYEPPQ